MEMLKAKMVALALNDLAQGHGGRIFSPVFEVVNTMENMCICQ